MVLAWVLFAATGTAIARYLKSFESFLTSTALCGAQLWFRVILCLSLEVVREIRLVSLSS